MTLLIDTHVLIWFAAGDRRLSAGAAGALRDPDRQIFVSVVTYWEIEVKRRRHPAFEIPEPVTALMARAGFLPLSLDFDVASLLGGLPGIHGDPFDRMLVAQALHHDLVLVTGDRMITRYPVETLW